MRVKKSNGKKSNIDKFIPANTYYEMVTNWDYKIVATECFGDYQGDEVYILEDKHSDKVGLAVIGYGSCGGCDALEAAYGNANELRALSQDLYNNVVWFDDYASFEAFVNSEKVETQWYWYEEEMKQFIKKYSKKQDND